MNPFPRRCFPSIFPALRGASGTILLLLGACSVGIDDRPVPPEAIPGVAFQEPASTAGYGDPAPAVRAAAPAYSSAPMREAGEGMVWRTGAQPMAVERAALPPPQATSTEEGGEEAVASAEDMPAGQEQPADASVEEPIETAAPQPPRVFRLASFVGVDAQAAAPLREAMLAEAAASGIRLSGEKQDLVLKGYLSSFEDGGATMLTYVWDVYDASGTRLTRIDGQRKLPEGSGGDPLRIGPATARDVARRTVAALARWQPDRAG